MILPLTNQLKQLVLYLLGKKEKILLLNLKPKRSKVNKNLDRNNRIFIKNLN